MLRRIALTLVPSVALFTVAFCLTSNVAPRTKSLGKTTTGPVTTAAPRVAARSGYIVASS